MFLSPRAIFLTFTCQLCTIPAKCVKLHDLEFENFSPNYRKFAKEGDWNSMISQIRTKSFFFKKSKIFLEENDFFSKIGKDGEFAVECP